METLECCDRMLIADSIRALTEEDLKQIAVQNDSMANRGLQVLAFAYCEPGSFRTGIEQRTKFSGSVIDAYEATSGISAKWWISCLPINSQETPFVPRKRFSRSSTRIADSLAHSGE